MKYNLVEMINKTFKEWSEDKASRLAAALAYYTSFSLAPLLVVIIAIAGIFGGGNAVQSMIMSQVGNLLGSNGEQLIASMIEGASHLSTGVIAALFGLMTLFFGALGMFGALQSALDTIWNIEPKPVKGTANSIRNIISKRILSFAMLLVIVFLLLVSLVISAALAALGKFIGNSIPVSDIALQIINLAISLFIITVLFALIFKYLPDAKIRWRDVILGAFVTAVLFSIGKYAISLYLGKSHVSTSFGAAGSLAVLLIWVYYSSQILFFGAEFTQVYANQYGSHIVPESHAQWIDEHDKQADSLHPGNAQLSGNGSSYRAHQDGRHAQSEIRCKQTTK